MMLVSVCNFVLVFLVKVNVVVFGEDVVLLMLDVNVWLLV